MSIKRVSVKTPSRLHFALVDLNGESGRVDGGAGVALEKPNAKITLEKIEARGEKQANEQTTRTSKKQAGNENEVIGTNEQRRKQIEHVLNFFNGNFRVEVEEEIPSHVGLGSTTQLLLAVAKACEELNGGKKSIRELACLVGRGGTSGVGVKAFESGGFIVDAGHSFGKGNEKEAFLPSSAASAPPPEIVFHSQLPKEWLFACVLPGKRETMIYGEKEKNIFQEKCPIPKSEVEKTKKIVYEELIESVREKDAVSFGECLNALQESGFKKIEWEYQSKEMQEAFELLKRKCLGAGLSSFGPLVFGFTDKNKIARKIKEEFENCFIAKASGNGAEIKVG
ncbi:hypothetical protein HY992_01575 [Candidatus Micrarchaeota archaeon]|nr:hypothetical protein [Candidatus Micrarchaeota archaeon]